MSEALAQMLSRSEALNESLSQHLENREFDLSAQGVAVIAVCAVALEHAAGLRMLIHSGCMTSAIALLRLQYESVARAMWLLYVAPDSAMQKITAPLNTKSEQAANNLPSLSKMLDEIRKGVGTRVPARASQMLDAFKDASWRSLNSYVHCGIHALRRQADGYPESLILDVLKSSNALATMAAMTLALLTDESTARTMSRIQSEYPDCLPQLLV